MAEWAMDSLRESQRREATGSEITHKVGTARKNHEEHKHLGDKNPFPPPQKRLRESGKQHTENGGGGCGWQVKKQENGASAKKGIVRVAGQ